MDHTNQRTEILKEAIALINGPRQQDYGSPSVSFDRIAKRWGQRMIGQSGDLVSAYDAAMAMADLKMARLMQGYHRDSILDAICYLALAHEMQCENEWDVLS